VIVQLHAAIVACLCQLSNCDTSSGFLALSTPPDRRMISRPALRTASRSQLEPVHPEEHLLAPDIQWAIGTLYLRAIGKSEDCRSAVDELVNAYRLIAPTA
jgi:hypothetical protein